MVRQADGGGCKGSIFRPNSDLTDPASVAMAMDVSKRAARSEDKTMLDRRKWTTSALLLTTTGVIVVGIGIYFVLFRPPLLPEDVRYMQLTEGDLTVLGPNLRDWLGRVFAVLGGFAMATGILMITLAATAFCSREPIAVSGAILGGAVSIGTMTAVNFAINSDFRWALLGPVDKVWQPYLCGCHGKEC
ncbi:hypothetical protein [Agrobacterium vitis]|nr:hypothetical protein [Agrobacterium vitis]